jgi:hypothetical protein
MISSPSRIQSNINTQLRHWVRVGIAIQLQMNVLILGLCIRNPEIWELICMFFVVMRGNKFQEGGNPSHA